MQKFILTLGLLLSIQNSFSQSVGDRLPYVKLSEDITVFSHKVEINDNGNLETADYVELFEGGYDNTYNGIDYLQFGFRPSIDDQIVWVEKRTNQGKHLRIIVTSRKEKKVIAVYTASYGMLRGKNLLTVESTDDVCPGYISFCSN